MSAEIDQLLERNHVPPQRYGTAFHLTPPVRDVRELDVDDFMANSLLDSSASRPAAGGDVESLLEQSVTDPYLLWHVAQRDRLPITALTAPAGSHQELAFAAATAVPTSEVLLITLEAGATLTLYDVATHRPLMLRHVHVIQHEQSQLHWWAIRDTLAYTHERMTVDLVGSEAVAHVTHLVAGRAASQYDGEIIVNHSVPATKADVRMRTVVSDKASVVYRGRLTVARAGRGTQGYQQGRALMLSSQAVADLLPQLDIGTNDVKCSHGVSTMHLDDAALFYLRSRGLSAADARHLAIRGFWHEQLVIPEPLRQAVDHLSV